MKLSTATRRGKRLDELETLALILAKQLEECTEVKATASLAKQYRETIREIEEIKGISNEEDELSEILSNRAANGLPGAIR